MKRFKFKKIKFNKVNLNDMDDRTLLLNLYATQLLTLTIGIIIVFFENNNPIIHLFSTLHLQKIIVWALCFTVLVIIADLLISRWVSEDVTDDGGINKMLFKNRAVWHIGLISLIVAICEEILFRGALQHVLGPYWTSIVFAAIHIRYLRHWVMTGLVFSISYGLGWIYIHTGSLWTPIIAHFFIDFVMGCILRYGRDK